MSLRRSRGGPGNAFCGSAALGSEERRYAGVVVAEVDIWVAVLGQGRKADTHRRGVPEELVVVVVSLGERRAQGAIPAAAALEPVAQG